MSGTYATLVREVELHRDDIDPAKLVSGSPEIYSAIMSTSYNGKILRGIWKCTVGTVRDVEEDEMFTVLEGRATVVIENGPTLELSPGVMGEFKKGDKTVWTIHENLLKTFQITYYTD